MTVDGLRHCSVGRGRLPESPRTAVAPSGHGRHGPNVAETDENREHTSNGDSCGQ
jgi:hypothetical protein